ncbi:MAG: hypothetical protein HY300_18690 [Verrucomicrobia bacterium]|nr:hypothetical protein [Verrucomicrobiota bacterium]
MKALMAIVCSLVLAVMPAFSSTRAAAPDCKPQARACCAKCAECCAQNNTPAPQPASPAPSRTASPQQVQLLLAAVAQFVALPQPQALPTSRDSSLIFRVPAVPLFERDCAWLV